MSSFWLNCKRYRGFTLFSLALFFLLVSLGFWQLSRADEKQFELETLESRQAMPVLTRIGSDISEYAYRKVELTGKFDPKRFWYLDNRSYKGKAGYNVIAAFFVDQSEMVLLVNLGWLPASAFRDEVPEVLLPEHNVTVRGMLREPIVNALYESMVNDLMTLWPQRVLSIDIETASLELDALVFPLILAIEPGHPQAYEAHWPVINVTPAKHTGYAVQWFSMALALVVLFVFMINNRGRKEKDERRGSNQKKS